MQSMDGLLEGLNNLDRYNPYFLNVGCISRSAAWLATHRIRRLQVYMYVQI